MRAVLLLSSVLCAPMVWALEFPQDAAGFSQALNQPVQRPAADCPPAIPDCQPKAMSAKGISNLARENHPEALREVVRANPQLPKAGMRLHFGYNLARLEPDSLPLLQQLAQALRGDAQQARVVLAGHTDALGSEAYNHDLAQRRADTVRATLAGLGVELERLGAVSFGETQPLVGSVTAQTDAERAQNRRVEIIRVE